MRLGMRTADIRFEREIRDPIYGYIFLTNIENEVLDSEIFQRLDRIFQMPTAQLVYPSAKHTRKTHSMGVMHLSHKAILHILYRGSTKIRKKSRPLLWGARVVTKENGDEGTDNFDQDLREKWWNKKSIEEIVQSVRLAGLLHDIGHAPFSHLFEDVCKQARIKIKFHGKNKIFDHETMSMKIVEEKQKEVGIKAPFDSSNVNAILDKKGSGPPFLHEIISGGYDCDKLDYLARDAYATGAVEFGGIDCERIIDGFRVINEQLCVSKSALDALMKSFDAVQYMYTSVYYHKTTRVFDFMIADILTKVREYLTDVVSDMEKFLKMDDFCFINHIKKYAEENPSNAHNSVIKTINDLRYRRKKYKDIFSHRISIDFIIREKTNRALKKIEKELQKEAKNLEIRVDFRPGIRPVGISPEELPTWLLTERIYDQADGKVKKFEEVCEAYHRRLTQLVILFRIYANRNQLKEDPNGTHKSEAKKIVSLTEEMLKQIENQYKKLRSS